MRAAEGIDMHSPNAADIYADSLQMPEGIGITSNAVT